LPYKQACLLRSTHGAYVRPEGRSMNYLAKTTLSLTLGVACMAAQAASPPLVGFQSASLVRYGDLNLNQEKDVARLYARITTAADQLCGPHSLSGIYSKWSQYAACFNDTVAQAVSRVHHPALSAYFRQHAPQSVALGNSIARQ
jgi:UrcA family protein